MKYIVLFLCTLFLLAGYLIGATLTQREFSGIVEQDIVSRAILNTRLHTVLLTRLREGRYEDTIQTLEDSLGVKEALLGQCLSPLCSAALSDEVREAKELINEYRKKYSNLN